MLPPQFLQHEFHPGQGGPPQMGGQGGGMPALHQAIQALHAAIAEQQDRGDKVLLAQALQIALKVQANDVSQGEGGRGAMQQGPQGPPQQPNPIAALIAARMAGGQ